MCSFFFFFLPDRPTHLHEREGDGKRNILLGWPKRNLRLMLMLDNIRLEITRTSKALFKWPANWVKVAVVHCTCKLQCSTSVEVGWETDITTPLRNFLPFVLFTGTNRPFFKYHMFNSTRTKFSIESVHLYTNAVTVLHDLVWGWRQAKEYFKGNFIVGPTGISVSSLVSWLISLLCPSNGLN